MPDVHQTRGQAGARHTEKKSVERLNFFDFGESFLKALIFNYNKVSRGTEGPALRRDHKIVIVRQAKATEFRLFRTAFHFINSNYKLLKR